MPLLDAAAGVEVLVEARELEPPPATGGNRFLTGWRPRGAGRRLLVPDPAGARLEGVSLGGAPRRLVLALAPSAAPGATLSVRVAGRSPVSVPLSPRVEVALPADLPRGRFVIDLGFGSATPEVLGAGFDRALPAGAVATHGADLEQGGVSLVEVVRPLAGATTLVGELRPPSGARPGQRFELREVRRSGESVLWSWQAGRWPRIRRSLRVPVRGEGGWLRLRLLAATPGPPATWRGLALRLPPVLRGKSAGSRPPAGLPVAPPSRPRLVILYVLDALRADALGPPRAGTGTPTLDRLGETGARFGRHFAVAPNTLPSTKALLTGRVWRQHGGATLPKEGGPTLAERWRAAGYRTGLFSGNVYVSRTFGVDRGFDAAPEGTIFGRETDAPPAHNDNAAVVHRAALAWLRSLPAGERVFLYLHVLHPHNPYDPPPPFRGRPGEERGATLDGSTATLRAIERGRLVATAADRRRIAALYRGGLAYADAEIARLLAGLRELYDPAETLVVVTADHGEELFDHGGVLHGYTLYDEMLHIPLLLHWPGRIAPRAIAEPTDTVDLHDALEALAGGHRPGSRSLWDSIAGVAARPGTMPSGAAGELQLAAAASVKGGIFMARTPRYKVVWAPRRGRHWGMGDGPGRSHDAEYVFDLVADPGERRNRAGLDVPEILWLRSRLLAWARAAEPGEELEPVLDSEARQQLRALGYAD